MFRVNEETKIVEVSGEDQIVLFELHMICKIAYERWDKETKLPWQPDLVTSILAFDLHMKAFMHEHTVDEIFTYSDLKYVVFLAVSKDELDKLGHIILTEKLDILSRRNDDNEEENND